MKKLTSVFLIIVYIFLSFALASCDSAGEDGSSVTKEYDEQVEEAISIVTEAWKEVYKEYKEISGTRDIADHIKIINTSVIIIKKDPTFEKEYQKETYERFLSDVVMIVEFEILSDLYGHGAGYMSNAQISREVAFHADGSAELSQMIFRTIGQTNLNYDYSSYVEEVIDLGSRFDRTVKIS